MTAPTGVDAHWAFHRGQTVFRPPLWQRLCSLFGVVMIGGIVAFFTVIAILLLHQGAWALAAFMTLLACFMAGLDGYVGKDLRGKWGLRVVLEQDALVLDLPAWRSLIHHPPALHARIRYDEIAAIETRLEAFLSLQMGIMQRAYVLHLKSGQLIFLFEDRAIGTPMETPVFTKLAADIAARAGVPLRDLGMNEGGGGFLGVWDTHAPDWAAPAPSKARQALLWRHVAMTGAIPVPLIVIAFGVRQLFGG